MAAATLFVVGTNVDGGAKASTTFVVATAATKRQQHHMMPLLPLFIITILLLQLLFTQTNATQPKDRRTVPRLIKKVKER